MKGLVIVLGLLCGCRQLFGFEDVVVATDAAPGIDAIDSAGDAPPQALVFVRRIDVNGAQVTGGPHVEFPMLIALEEPYLRTRENGGEIENAQGFDLAFAADQAGTMRLAHEVESYDPATGSLIAWVKLPSLTDTTSLFLHYGDPSITSSLENVPAVWSADYAGVWHLTSGRDSISQAESTNSGSVTAIGKIGLARAFNGTTSRVDVADTTAITNVFDGGGTVEAWILATSSGENSFGRIIDKGEVVFGLGDGNVANSGQYGHGFTNAAPTWNTAGNTVPKNTMNHLVAVYDATSTANDPTIYVNGILRLSAAGMAPAGTRDSDAGLDLVIGNRAAGDRTFDGTIDELRLSRTVRTTAWIATEFSNQSNPGGFYTVSAPL